jgi:hypothetical protein
MMQINIINNCSHDVRVVIQDGVPILVLAQSSIKTECDTDVQTLVHLEHICESWWNKKAKMTSAFHLALTSDYVCTFSEKSCNLNITHDVERLDNVEDVYLWSYRITNPDATLISCGIVDADRVMRAYKKLHRKNSMFHYFVEPLINRPIISLAVLAFGIYTAINISWLIAAAGVVIYDLLIALFCYMGEKVGKRIGKSIDKFVDPTHAVLNNISDCMSEKKLTMHFQTKIQ